MLSPGFCAIPAPSAPGGTDERDWGAFVPLQHLLNADSLCLLLIIRFYSRTMSYSPPLAAAVPRGVPATSASPHLCYGSHKNSEGQLATAEVGPSGMGRVFLHLQGL